MKGTDWKPDGVDVRRLRQQQREMERRLRIVRRLLTTLEADGIGSKGRRRRRRVNTRLSQIVTVLKQEGRPLPVLAIYQRLQESDPALKWSQPTAAFLCCLREQEDGRDMVVRVGRGMYGLRNYSRNTSEHLPEGGST